MNNGPVTHIEFPSLSLSHAGKPRDKELLDSDYPYSSDFFGLQPHLQHKKEPIDFGLPGDSEYFRILRKVH